MQVLLARLQIPYLKAAILDRKLFAHRQHPARRLLDCLAEQAKGWSEESDRDHRLHDKVKSIVEQLLHDFDDDMGIFERLLVDLQQFQDINKRRSELAEQRVAESTRGREKLEQARRRAAREILDRIGEHEAAAAGARRAGARLGQPSGADPAAPGRGLARVQERAALRRRIHRQHAAGHDAGEPPGCCACCRASSGRCAMGLANVAFQEQDIERLLAQLHAYYRQQLGETLEPAEVVAVDGRRGHAGDPRQHPAGRSSSDAAAGRRTAVDDIAERAAGQPANGSRCRRCSPAPGWSSAWPTRR